MGTRSVLRSAARWLQPLDLPLEGDGGEEEGPARRGWLRERWRGWMLGPVVAVAVVVVALVAAVVPVVGTVVRPGTVLEAGSLVDVDVPDRGEGRGGEPGGAYLLPEVRTTRTALARLVAWWPGDGLVAGPAATRQTAGGVDLLDLALLTGAGVAAGRGDPDTLGLHAGLREDDLAPDPLGILLHVVDVVMERDVAAGRRVLALGAVTADGTISCSPEPSTTLAAVRPPPDVVVLGRGCGAGLDPPPGTAVLEVPALIDALVALSSR